MPTETLLSRIKLDLSEAQRSKVELQARLTARTEESERLKGVSQLNAKRVQELSAERNTLHTRVRDRDEELREKAKLLEVGFEMDCWASTHGPAKLIIGTGNT